MYAKGYAGFSNGGIQDQDTLIEQSTNYSNRASSGGFEICPNTSMDVYNEMHWLITKPDLSTCVFNFFATENAIRSNHVLFKFQIFTLRGCILCLIV